ncbi:hypothetical protein CASFOL_031853 [Castilleja foliolosa]|uniref:Uncharacterized protein n=1 Tax=Castilleja foliolosa TaxID=1961234 RepID=A0ABD3C0E6_9LAMI
MLDGATSGSGQLGFDQWRSGHWRSGYRLSDSDDWLGEDLFITIQSAVMGDLYALDFDGVLCDSCRESSLSAFEAKVRWPNLFNGVDSLLEDWIVDQMHILLIDCRLRGEFWAIFEVVTTKQIGVGCGGFLNLSTTETDILQNDIPPFGELHSERFEILHQLRNKIKSKILGREGLFEVIVSSKQLRVDSFNVSRLTIDDEIKDVYIMRNYPAPYESNTSDDSFLQTLNYVEEKDRAVTRGETKDIEAEADSKTTHTKKQKTDELDK